MQDWWAQRPAWFRWSTWAAIGAAFVLLGNVGGSVEKVWAAIDGYIASKAYVREQNTQTASQVVSALAPRIESLTSKIEAQTDDVIRSRIVAASASIVTLNAQIEALAPLLADYPHNGVLVQKDADLRRQLANMQSSLSGAVCELNQRRTPGYVCPPN